MVPQTNDHPPRRDHYPLADEPDAFQVGGVPVFYPLLCLAGAAALGLAASNVSRPFALAAFASAALLFVLDRMRSRPALRLFANRLALRCGFTGPNVVIPLDRILLVSFLDPKEYCRKRAPHLDLAEGKPTPANIRIHLRENVPVRFALKRTRHAKTLDLALADPWAFLAEICEAANPMPGLPPEISLGEGDLEHALFYALRGSRLEHIKALVDQGVDLNAECRGQTAVEVAAAMGKADIAAFLEDARRDRQARFRAWTSSGPGAF